MLPGTWSAVLLEPVEVVEAQRELEARRDTETASNEEPELRAGRVGIVPDGHDGLRVAPRPMRFCAQLVIVNLLGRVSYCCACSARGAARRDAR
jgi:hypothetical protein